jgi:hypothetical protein
MSDGLLRCCREHITACERLFGAEVVQSAWAEGQTVACGHCGAELLWNGHAWEWDAEQLQRIRAAYAQSRDSQPAAAAYRKLFDGGKDLK